MLTRCPTCTTTFRVTPEQLKARLGRVRCGQCRSVFNALDSLVEETSAIPSTIPAPPPAPFANNGTEPVSAPALEQEQAAPATSPVPEPAAADTAAVQDEEDTTPFLTTPLPYEPATVAEPHSEAANDWPETLPLPPEQAPGFTVATAAEFSPAAPSATAATEPSPVMAEVSTPDALVSAPKASTQPVPAIEEDKATAAGDDSDPPITTAPPAPDPLLHYAPHRRAPRWPWLAGSLLAGSALLLQLALHYRVEIATLNPGLKPALQALCAPLHCAVPLPHKINLLSIETSDLHPGTQKGQLQLEASLKNKAPFAQEYPLLEITLTDVTDQPLLVKSLQPAEYLPQGFAPEDGFPARKEIAVNLTLTADNVPASGYRLYLYHP